MIIVVWRAAGPSFDVDSFLKRFPGIQPDAVWHKGDARRSGGVQRTSGFSKVLGESDSSRAIVGTIRRRIDQWTAILRALRRMSVPAEIDFGMTVGGVPEFTRSLRFARRDLSVLLAREVDLVVSAYPTSEA